MKIHEEIFHILIYAGIYKYVLGMKSCFVRDCGLVTYTGDWNMILLQHSLIMYVPLVGAGGSFLHRTLPEAVTREVWLKSFVAGKFPCIIHRHSSLFQKPQNCFQTKDHFFLIFFFLSPIQCLLDACEKLL